MARKTASRKIASLALPTVAHKRFDYEQRSGNGGRAAAIHFKAVNEKPVFVETEEGHLVRQWKKEEMQRYSNGDIAQAIQGASALEEEDMLEWIPPSAIKYAVTQGWLFRDGFFYRVTRKAAAELSLPTSKGGQKIRFYDAGLH